MRRVFFLLVWLSLLIHGWSKEIISMPFELDQLRGYICVQAFVNDRGPYWFIFDTGASTVALYQKYATLLRQQGKQESEMQSKDDPRSNSGTPLKIRVEGTSDGEEAALTFHLVDELFGVVTIEPPMIFIRNQFIEPVGLMTFNFLVSFDYVSSGRTFMHISYDSRRIRLLSDSETEGWLRVPTERTQSGLFKVRLTLQEKQVEFLLDSGAESTITIDAEMQQFLKNYLSPPLEKRAFITIRGKEEKYVFSGRRLPPVFLNDLRVDIPWIYVGRANILGSLCMLQFNWLIDLERDQVYVQSRKNTTPVLRWNRPTPVAVQKRSSDYFVKAGFHTLPYLLGINEESRLLEVDGLNVSSLEEQTDFSQHIMSLILSPFRSQVRLKVERSDKVIEVSFRLLDYLSVHELLNTFIPNISADEDGIWVTFESARIVDSKTQEQIFNRRFLVLQIEGHPKSDLAVEDLIEYLHARLLGNKPAELLCRDESGRERWVRVIPRNPPPAAPSEADTSRK